MRTLKKAGLPNLSQIKQLSALKDTVAWQLEKRGLPADISWNVMSIDISDRDVEFSQWLEEAAKTYKVLKRRGEFCLRLSH